MMFVWIIRCLWIFLYFHISALQPVYVKWIWVVSTRWELAAIHLVQGANYKLTLRGAIWLSLTYLDMAVRQPRHGSHQKTYSRVQAALFVSRLSGSTEHDKQFWKQDKWIYIASEAHTENLSQLRTLHLNDLKLICWLCSDSAVKSYCSRRYDSIRFQSFNCAEWGKSSVSITSC